MSRVYCVGRCRFTFEVVPVRPLLEREQSVIDAALAKAARVRYQPPRRPQIPGFGKSVSEPSKALLAALEQGGQDWRWQERNGHYGAVARRVETPVPASSARVYLFDRAWVGGELLDRGEVDRRLALLDGAVRREGVAS